MSPRCHGTFSCPRCGGTQHLVINEQGDLLLQKRSPKKDIQPGKWDTSVGGHLDLGESYLVAARREMSEELGVSDLALVFLYRSTIRNLIESENIETYLAEYPGKIYFDPGEITEVGYWSPSHIEENLGKEIFTPNFEDEWLMFLNFIQKLQTCASAYVGTCVDDSPPEIFEIFKERGTQALLSKMQAIEA